MVMGHPMPKASRWELRPFPCKIQVNSKLSYIYPDFLGVKKLINNCCHFSMRITLTHCYVIILTVCDYLYPRSNLLFRIHFNVARNWIFIFCSLNSISKLKEKFIKNLQKVSKLKDKFMKKPNMQKYQNWRIRLWKINHTKISKLKDTFLKMLTWKYVEVCSTWNLSFCFYFSYMYLFVNQRNFHRISLLIKNYFCRGNIKYRYTPIIYWIIVGVLNWLILLSTPTMLVEFCYLAYYF